MPSPTSKDLYQLAEKIDGKLDKLAENIERKYVTKTEFTPVKQIVYGLVSLILLTVVAAVIATVVKAK